MGEEKGEMHLDDSLRRKYTAGDTSEEEDSQVEDHIAGCGRCMVKVRALQFLQYHGDEFFESWTAQAHGEALAASEGHPLTSTPAEFENSYLLVKLHRAVACLSSEDDGKIEQGQKDLSAAIEGTLGDPKLLDGLEGYFGRIIVHVPGSMRAVVSELFHTELREYRSLFGSE